MWDSFVVQDKLKIVTQYVNSHYYQLDPAIKEDLYQAGCMGLLEGLKKFDPNKGKNLDSWLYFYVKHRIQDFTANYWVRESAVARYIQDRSVNPYGENKDDLTDLKEALSELTGLEKKLVDLYHLQGYSISEVSKLVGLSRSTCSRRINDAEQQLKAAMTSGKVIKKRKRRCKQKQLAIQSRLKGK